MMVLRWDSPSSSKDFMTREGLGSVVFKIV